MVVAFSMFTKIGCLRISMHLTQFIFASCFALSIPQELGGRDRHLIAENGGPTMFARIGFMRALNRHVPRTFNPDRKDHHWGKRKLKRDQ
jgi:hypothetical protein